MPTIESDTMMVFEDRDQTGEWRVEYFDNDGGCYVTIDDLRRTRSREASAGQSRRTEGGRLEDCYGRADRGRP
jgi:hypothetical protein